MSGKSPYVSLNLSKDYESLLFKSIIVTMFRVSVFFILRAPPKSKIISGYCTPNVERVFPFPRPQPKIFLVPLIQNDIPVRVRVAEKALLGMRTLNIAGN